MKGFLTIPARVNRLLRRTRRIDWTLSARRWRSGRYVSEASPIVVGGCGRSGTTLLRVMLDSHPRICCGPESQLFLKRPLDRRRIAVLSARFDMDADLVRRLQDSAADQAEFIDRFFAHYCTIAGKPRWAEKTPQNVEVLDFVFERFPSARFIHVIRDGRDTVCSLRTHPRHRVVDGELVPVETWNPIEECIDRWVTRVGAGLRYRGHPGYTEVRYEDLVTAARPTIRELLDWLGEPWSESVLEFSRVQGASREAWKFPQNPEATRPIYQSATGRWRTELTSADAALFKKTAGPLLIELGYAEDDAWEPLG